MVNRLMDLVVLVAELSQKTDKSFKDLDKELIHLGYSSEEIEQALFWMSSQWRPVDHKGASRMDRPAFRVFSPWETSCVDAESHNYLLRLHNLGLVDDAQFEKIMTRMTPYGGDQLQLGDVKALAGNVMFNLGADETDEEWLQTFDDEIQVT